MPPDERPMVCRFAAEPPQGSLPHGRWADTLQAEFLGACLRVEPEGDDDVGAAGTITWFPDRTWSGRTYVPATARTSTGMELYGYVSFSPGDDEREPGEFFAWADYTPDTADQNPEWQMDISQEVIGGWRGERGMVAAMTLIWGVPIERRGRIATAELGADTVDATEIIDERFTLLAPDAYDDKYLEVVLKDDVGDVLVRESLYEDEDDE
jgi:hypothetical protein